ncbi:Sec-independent periplasmic protein translocase [Natronococcus amylolyticus DSM 10524]|uniref:Sec-independent protein translocase protein TatC n=1 Tax=Natronococcus amylolyticus DSM 10524 TaxID=1227497 RepID=L9XAT6_9EURY|nr:twin-arginine translocase subunit TatC [Natronococcus amylolyticus]ELY58859.1 Sec-independent periplasmic protein translocase [Natronococcus amylolyticus DSM 10524]
MSDESATDGDVEPPEEPRDEPEDGASSDADPALDADDEIEPGDDDDDTAEVDDGTADADEMTADVDDDTADSDDVAADTDDEADADGALETADDDEPELETDGEGVVGDRPEESDTTYPDPDEDVGGISTPPDDEEMPLADHIEEMVLRLAVVLLIGSAGTAIGLLWASQAIDHVWNNVFPSQFEQVPPPHIYHPLELWLTRIKLSALLGIMVALPMFVYQCYLFMKPGLYPNERKYYLAAVPTSVVLAGLGMIFSYLLVLPILFQYFTFYAEGSAGIAYALGDTFNLIITLTGFLAIVFQIPLFMMLAIMMGVTTREWLADKRLYFWAGFAGLAFLFTVDPTMMAPILVAITMILLFEGTLLLLKWTGR